MLRGLIDLTVLATINHNVLETLGHKCTSSECDNCFDDLCHKERKMGVQECKSCCGIVPALWGFCGDEIDKWCQQAPPHSHNPAHSHSPAPGHRHNPHGHNPHGHNPHRHNPHRHNPHHHHPHHPHHPQPACASWPSFGNAATLAASPWGAYFTELYGSMPPTNRYPLDVGSFWVLWDDLTAKHAVPLPASSGRCAPANCQLSLYTLNNAYAPPKTSWIWHPPPYNPSDYAPPPAPNPWTGWVEVTLNLTRNSTLITSCGRVGLR